MLQLYIYMLEVLILMCPFVFPFFRMDGMLSTGLQTVRGCVSTIQYLAPKMESLLHNTTNTGSSMLHLTAQAGRAKVVRLVIDDYKLNFTACDKVSEY